MSSINQNRKYLVPLEPLVHNMHLQYIHIRSQIIIVTTENILLHKYCAFTKFLVRKGKGYKIYKTYVSTAEILYKHLVTKKY